jgi:transcription-repair coupling factor (superfamily II helicase)
VKSEKNLILLFPYVQNTRVLDLFDRKKNISLSGAGNYSSKVFAFADVVRKEPKFNTVIWVVNDYTEQQNIERSVRMWSDFEPYGYNIESSEISNVKSVEKSNRIKTIEFASRLLDGRRKVIVTPYINLLGALPDPEEIRKNSIVLKKGDTISTTELFEALIDRGYEVSDDKLLEKGTYHRSGEVLTLFPINTEHPVKIEIGFDQIGRITFFDQQTKDDLAEIDRIDAVPLKYGEFGSSIAQYFNDKTIVVEDELDIIDDYYDAWNSLFDEVYDKVKSIAFVSFNEDDENHEHLHYISVLKYRGAYDLANDMREKQRDEWRVMVFTKESGEIKNILNEYNISFHEEGDATPIASGQGIYIFDVKKDDILPHAFQNPELKLALISDKEFSSMREEKKKIFNQKVYLDFLTSLKINDYVVHANHGIGRFLGLEKKTVDDVTREYMKIGYAENDKLYIPIDQADKVNKYIGGDEQPPKLTRLGSAEWDTITKKVQKETEIIAKELLQLYAQRKSARGVAFKPDNDLQAQFEKEFPYEETPGQLKSIIDVKRDMERNTPMDRLICGDVGFGKTEVAMRAAFKAVQSGYQAALISPITILADQHYRSFVKRMGGFNVRVELLSRFRTPAQQKEILKKLERGEVDVVIGTHRLLQPDVKFKNLGLVVVDEEQRFGVKQKEALKQLKTEVDVVTLTATPIPRTLNIALNKLRDISTISTPPPGRLPVITEVRRFSQGLIRDAILREVSRGGQTYFLHNRVQTIDSMADKLRVLVPEARFGVAHGKLGSSDLEERILAFKDHKFDVLVSSTIIENGIDLSNANTLIVNNAERLGLAQLYQLRGRVGRSRTQAYAYFLYHGQRLKLDAKKRLRAIVEATELGSGFQIAMKDLEIRGAGDILGAKQHGVINVVGVSHFIRMLNKAVDDLKAGKVMQAEEPEEISIELPLTAYIPDTYIVSSKDKINAYQKMAAADNMEYLTEIKDELLEEYGKMPTEVINLFRILELKILAKQAKLVNVKAEVDYAKKMKEIVLHMSGLVKPENIVNLLEYNSKWYISGTRLRIKIEDLGMHWFDELRESVQKLTQSIKPST